MVYFPCNTTSFVFFVISALNSSYVGLEVVGSRCWPLISRYRASVRSQSPKVEMIDALFKPLDNGNDDGIIRFDLIYWTIAILYDLHPFYVKD
jgi:hypothetical protein